MFHIGAIHTGCGLDQSVLFEGLERTPEDALELLSQWAQLVKVESIHGSLIADLESCGLAIDHAAYGRFVE